MLAIVNGNANGKVNGDENCLPLVNLTVDTALLNRNHYIEGVIEITEEGMETARYLCWLRYRGSSSTECDKKSFAVKLHDEAGEDVDANIFGIREENSWILDAMAIDRTRMRNRVCFDIWNEMSRTPYETKYENRNGTEGVFVELYVNGEYHGLYCLSDKVDRKLLGLKKPKSGDDGELTVRGLMYKGDAWNDYTDIYLLSYGNGNENQNGNGKWNAWELQYPDETLGVWQPLKNLIKFCSEQTEDEEFMASYQDYFYTENLADYVVFTLALHVGDNMYKNTFLSVADITKGHRFMITPWDMDMSLGGHWNGKYNEGLSDVNQYNNRAPFNRLIGKNLGGFADKLADTWMAYCTSLFAPENISRRLDRYEKLLTASGAWEREYAKWNGNPVPLKEHLGDEVDYVKKWYAKNYESLCLQFGTPPVTIGIANVVGPDSPEAVYTLDGRKVHASDVSSLRKGLYVVKGRKILVK